MHSLCSPSLPLAWEDAYQEAHLEIKKKGRRIAEKMAAPTPTLDRFVTASTMTINAILMRISLRIISISWSRPSAQTPKHLACSYQWEYSLWDTQHDNSYRPRQVTPVQPPQPHGGHAAISWDWLSSTWPESLRPKAKEVEIDENVSSAAHAVTRPALLASSDWSVFELALRDALQRPSRRAAPSGLHQGLF